MIVTIMGHNTNNYYRVILIIMAALLYKVTIHLYVI